MKTKLYVRLPVAYNTPQLKCAMETLTCSPIISICNQCQTLRRMDLRVYICAAVQLNYLHYFTFMFEYFVLYLSTCVLGTNYLLCIARVVIIYST